MKMNSIIYSYLRPLSLPPHRAALSFAGFMRPLSKLSAKGFPLGTYAPAVLLAALVRQFKALATPDPNHAPVTRELAGLIINELCDRYEIPVQAACNSKNKFSK